MTTYANVNGIFELHVFVGPLNPPDKTVQDFKSVCRANGMKPLHLTLEFPKSGETVSVMQSSRYVTGDIPMAVEAIHEDSAHFSAAGFEVLRHKVEATASAEGVPVDHDQLETMQLNEPCTAPNFSSVFNRYFEFHLLIGAESLEGNMDGLRDVVREGHIMFVNGAPLSWNNLKPSQRFINCRFHNRPRVTAFMLADILKTEVELRKLHVEKVIREYIVYDDNNALDAGWLEPPFR